MNEKGQPDVAAELWINAVREPLFAAMDEGTLSDMLSPFSLTHVRETCEGN
jgi:glycine betaine/proline transport system substrate-binding protein